MSRPAVLSPRARREAAAAIAWIAQSNPAAARRLRDALVEAASLLGRRPAAGRLDQRLVGERYRIWSTAGFPYIMIYNPDAVPPRIIRIVHTARDLPSVLQDLI